MGAASSLTAFANIYKWPGICRLIYVVQLNVISEQLSQSVLSFTRATLVVKVSGGFTRDLQALPGHLAALPGHLQALPGHLAALPGHLAALPGHLAALPGHLAALPGHLAAAYPLDPAVAWAPAGFGGR